MKIKTILYTSIFTMIALTANGQQLRTAFPSPQGKVFQKIGMTDVEISYYRPRVKGRQIFGSTPDHLIKYGQIWFAGANVASTITLSTEVNIEGESIPAGKYAIYTIPEAEEWTIMLYTDLKLGGNVALYDVQHELVRFKASVRSNNNHRESLTFTFDEVKDNTMQVELHWASVAISFTLETDYQGMIVSQIENVMKNPYGIAAQNFRQSALFYLNYDRELDKALEWINEAIKIAPSMFDHGLKADILIKMENPKAAIKALNAAHKAGAESQGRLKSIYENSFKRQLDQKLEKLKQ